nr:unnamed protein product [Callosobruchus analis]
MESEACSSTSSSEFEENLENVAAFLLLHEGKRKKWVHEINVRREELGEYHRLVQELNEHPDRYHMYFRMTKDEFNFLHELIKEDIKKQNTQFRRAISTEERLAVCLRFLATGNSFRSMGFSYRLGFSTVREIVIEVCDAIWKNLGPIVMPEPTTDIWMKSAEKFKQIWDFPNCIAAIDGKHINIQCPINAGSTFYNYEGSHSIVLLALVDADYKFITIDVGAYGRNSGGGIFEKSEIGKKLQRGTFSVPGNVPLKTNGLPQPHIIVGDEAFPLKTYLLRPYSRFHLDENEPNKIYNYRLSRARRVVENAFGILVARWRVFRRHLEVQPYLVDKIVLASCCLHNMLCSDSLEPDIPTLHPFHSLWNLPNCIGSIDGKHIRIQAPSRQVPPTLIIKDFFNCFTRSSRCRWHFVKNKKRKNRRWWVHPINSERYLHGHSVPYYHASDQILRSFSIISECVPGPDTHEDTNMRKAISAEEMLAFTLRYLASGCSLKDIHYNYRMGRSTVAKLIRIVCITIWNILRNECMPELNESMWLNIAEGFRNQANFPNFIGAVDGKHIRVVKPVGSGSSYMNYKHFFSITLLGIADSNYNFVYVDIGSFGKDSDATIFQNSSLWKKLENKCLNIPKPTLVPGIEHPLPFAFVGDEAFGLTPHLLRPYSGKQLASNKRVFNYRLSRARRYIECTFGIMSNKWRILHRPMDVDINFAVDIIKCLCILHNFVRKRDGYRFEDTLSVVGQSLRLHFKNIRDKSNLFELPEKKFIKLFRLNKEAAMQLVGQLQELVEETSRGDTVPFHLEVFAALLFYAHGGYQTTVGDDFNLGMSQPVISRAIRKISSLIAIHLSPLYIKFPVTAEEVSVVKDGFFEVHQFPNLIGVIDCTHIAIVLPKVDDPTNPAIFDSKLMITNVYARYPGAVHDAAIWESSNIQRHLRQKYVEGRRNCYLLGDSGYPLQPWLMTPVLDARPNTPEAMYNSLHTSNDILTEDRFVRQQLINQLSAFVDNR